MANPNYEFQGLPDETERIVVTDVAQQFTTAQYMKNSSPAIAVVITCETHQIRFCLGGSTPTAGATGLGHILYVGQSLRLSSGRAIQTFSFINHTDQSAGVIQATWEFEPGV
uniref:Uncharacterized protein n=1 Tax=viral metagenome TaxID=1070528 RepID=A0A6H1ZMU1_9ZZZZ